MTRAESPATQHSSRLHCRAPASLGQQGLWIHQTSHPLDTSYNMSTVLRLKGRLDVGALRRALAEIQRRHEVLRTSFEEQEGVLIQRVVATSDLTPGAFEAVAAGERSAVVRLAREAGERPFDLSQPGLFRVRLLAVGPGEHVLILTMHHLIMDGWSMGILARELEVLYAAFAAGGEAPLAELEVQYRDFAVRQREQIQGDRLAGLVNYWRTELAGARPVTLPADLRAGPSAVRPAGRVRFQTSPELTGRLKELSREEGGTLFMILLAAFQAVLSRYTGQEDVVVGTPVAGRNRREYERLIGLFVKLLPLRVDLSGNPTFREFLRGTRKTTLAAYSHQELPFATMVEKLRPYRQSAADTPYVSTVFALNSFPRQPWRLSGLEVVEEEAVPGMARFDLDVWIRETGGGLDGQIDFHAGKYEPETIRRFSVLYRDFLAAVLENVDCRIREFDPASVEDRSILVARRDESVPETGLPDVVELFEAQARRTPAATAVVCGADAVSYRDLNARANALAQDLRARGVGPEVFVGVCMSRSVEIIVGLIAILKAGGAYLPMDATHPAERLLSMLDDSGAAVLLTEPDLEDKFPGYRGQVLHPDTRSFPAGCADAGRRVSPRNAAYMIYTSGSTGKPKSVVVEHRSLANFLFAMTRWVDDPSSSRTWLAVTTISFDIAALELLWTLSHGYRVILYRDEHAGPAGIPSDIVRHGVTHLQCTPTLLRIVTDLPDGPTALKRLRRLMIGGEVLPVALAERVVTQVPEVLNLYGPTEATVWSTVHRIGNIPTSVPVGGPIANTQVYVLDDEFRPVPRGVYGELCIGGEGVARGYSNAPGMTAGRFLPDPFSGVAGARLYRTGDRARLRNDGTVELLGRVDRQVKIRGHRVEPAEVEAALGSHEAVGQAVVTASSGSDGPDLTAWIVPAPGARPEEEADAAGRSRLSDWRAVWDETYRQAGAPDPTFDTTGWTSRCDGRPFPEAVMREWVETTVERIRALKPKRVLEIGCGTGLLLFRLAPECEFYHATDVSPSVVDSLQRQLEARKFRNARIEAAAAHELDCEASFYDLIVLNSVVQYFPGIGYLEAVLDKCAGWTASSGHIFVGDVLNRDLLEALHASIVLAETDGAIPIEDLRLRARHHMLRERELSIAPAFFWALETTLPKTCRVETQLRRGRHVTELTQFRYDALIHLDADDAHPTGVLDWRPGESTVEDVGNRLSEMETESSLVIRGIPNGRLSDQCGLTSRGADPEAFWSLAERLGGGAVVDWSPEDPCLFDATLFRSGATPGRTIARRRERRTDTRPLWNDPLRLARRNQLEPQLREHLGTYLPAYMIPSAFMACDEIPRTPNGKVDRAALERLSGALGRSARRPTPERGAPQTTTETQVGGIWEEVLGVSDVGPDQDFFALGGHSLAAIQIASRIARAFGVEIMLGDVMTHATVRSLASHVERATESEKTSKARPVSSAAPRDPAEPALSVQQKTTLMQELRRGNGEPQNQIRLVLRVRGALDVSLLERSVNKIISRHEMLRTSYVPVFRSGPVRIQGWTPVRRALNQQTIDSRNISFDQQTHTGVTTQVGTLHSGEQEAPAEALERTVRDIAREDFDFSRAPLIRVRLLRMSEDDHALLTTMPHLASDGWSLALFARELFSLYANGEDATSTCLPSRDATYADYIRFQREQLAESAKRAAEAREADSESKCLDVGALSIARKGRVPTFGASPRLASGTLALDDQEHQSLKAVCQSVRVTVGMFAFACLASYLHIRSGLSHFGVWILQANRGRPELENVIGFMAGAQVVRVRCTRDSTIASVMEDVRNEWSAAARRNIGLPRGATSDPGREVAFEYRKEVPMPQVSGLAVERIEAFDALDGRSEFAMKLLVLEDGQSVRMRLNCRDDRFDPGVMTALLRDLKTIMHAAFESPDVRIRDVASRIDHAEVPHPARSVNR